MRFFLWLAIFLIALLVSTATLIALLPLGLIVVESVSLTLALGVAALLTAVVASWTGNFLLGDGTRTNILRVVGATVLIATVVVLTFLLPAVREALLGPLLVMGLVCALLLAFVATAATARFRTIDLDRSQERRLTIALLVLALLSIPVVIGIASLFGLTGA